MELRGEATARERNLGDVLMGMRRRVQQARGEYSLGLDSGAQHCLSLGVGGEASKDD